MNNKSKKTTGRWTKAEQNRFLQGLSKFGRNWVEVQKIVKTRTLVQVRSHAQKVFLNMSEEDICSIVGQDSSYQESQFSEVSRDWVHHPFDATPIQKNQVKNRSRGNIDLVGIFMKAIQESNSERESEEMKIQESPRTQENLCEEVEEIGKASPITIFNF